MFGNKFAAEELARNFQNRMSTLKSMKKSASQRESTSKVAQVKAEDFLVDPPEEVDVHGSDLDSKIEEVGYYASDSCPKCNSVHDGSCMALDKCEKCGEAHDMESACGDMGAGEVMVVPLMADDAGYLVDSRAEYVLQELGKVASGLRQQGKGFAADMVEATAIEIRDEALKTAAKKLEVVSGLEKMAKESYDEGDRMTGDVILSTIQNIKKG